MNIVKFINNEVQAFAGTGSYNKHRKIDVPVYDNDVVVATDGIKLIVAPRGYVNSTLYETRSKLYPEYRSVIPEHNKDVALFETDAQWLYDEILLLPYEDVYTLCDRCEGDGDLYTKSGRSRDCDRCDGTGNGEYEGNMIRIPDMDDEAGHNGSVVLVDGVYHNPNSILAAARVCMAVNAPMRWVRSGAGISAIIYAHDIMMLLMPLRTPKEEMAKYKGKLNEIIAPIKIVKND